MARFYAVADAVTAGAILLSLRGLIIILPPLPLLRPSDAAFSGAILSFRSEATAVARLLLMEFRIVEKLL